MFRFRYLLGFAVLLVAFALAALWVLMVVFPQLLAMK